MEGLAVIIQRNIELEEGRCYTCGRFYATERGVSAQCPYCAESRSDVHAAAMEAARRSIAALRGALTKAKARVAS